MKLFIGFLIVLISNTKAVELLNGRIVGGQDADIADFSYQVSLQMVGHHICGGAFIGKNWIITAAHCFRKNYNPIKILSVRAGTSIHNNGGNVFKFAEIYMHPEFNKSSMIYDVALIRTETEIIGNNINAIRLPESNMLIQAGKTAIVSGWGYLQYKGKYFPENLQYIKINVVDQEECKKTLSAYINIGKTMLCAAADGKDACKGDSGGPIVVDGTLVGVVSFGIGCADPDSPGVYTHLANPDIRKWIKELSEI